MGPNQSIEINSTLEGALAAQLGLMCGGKCCSLHSNVSDWHQIWDLSGRGFKRIDKRQEYERRGVNYDHELDYEALNVEWAKLAGKEQV